LPEGPDAVATANKCAGIRFHHPNESIHFFEESHPMKLRHVLSALLILTLCSAAFAQKTPITRDGLTLAGTDLTLGMAKDVVIARLATESNVTKISGDNDTLLIRSKPDSPMESGEVIFKDKRLIYAERDWSSGEDAVSFIYALRSLLIQFGNEGRHFCSVATGGGQGTDGQTQKIALICGAKRLEISVNEVFSGPYQGKSTSLQEIIGSSVP
jgi:hypothetical protein